ncbi:MAG: dihydropteroate synthase [Capsulimonadaceae bacterium]
MIAEPDRARLLLPDLGRRTLIMGVLNVTPDSFSDGGLYATVDAAVEHGRRMVADGADILDIGGESTRPATFRDNQPLPAPEECARVVPVIAALAGEFPYIPISVDTYKAAVAEAALDAGASIVNDISGLMYDPEMAPLAAARRCPVVVMHLLGRPRDIPSSPVYEDVIGTLIEHFARQVAVAHAAGVDPSQILLDPGIGFGKTTEHNVTILRRLPELAAIGYPLVVGPSRKRFIGAILDLPDPNDRVEGTAAAVALSIAGGASIVRVHDIRPMSRVVRVSDAIVRGWRDTSG